MGCVVCMVCVCYRLLSTRYFLFSSHGELHLVFVVWVCHSRTEEMPVHSAHIATKIYYSSVLPVEGTLESKGCTDLLRMMYFIAAFIRFFE